MSRPQSRLARYHQSQFRSICDGSLATRLANLARGGDLPTHRDEEAAGAVIHGLNSVILDEAENRLHAQQAILRWCLDVWGGRLFRAYPVVTHTHYI